uniref:Glycosyltransferase n=1 Tax=Enterococcus faecalis TaxID=1351 RepID=A0A0G4DBE0_ENTFL|nr:glycosyltransferase [Enterococcus faecalis]
MIELNDYILGYSNSYENELKSKSISNIGDTCKISFLIMTYNEERCIQRCINSINPLANEIIIIDTGSTDNTLNVISELKNKKVKLFKETWVDDFSYMRNQLIKKANNDWMFMIDADEFIGPVSLEKLSTLINIVETSNVVPKVISPRLTNTDGSSLYITQRLFKRHTQLKYFGYAHEELRFYNDPIFPYICIDLPFYHDGYDNEIVEEKNKNDRNLRLLKKMLESEPNNLRWVFFCAREMLSLNYASECIKEMVITGLKNSKDDFPVLKSGLYSILMETSMESDEAYNEYQKNALECNPNNIDIYYLDALKKFNELILEGNNYISKSQNEILSLKETDSFIHSEGDHLFYLWGKIHFSLQNYKQAFLWWNKIGAYNIRNDVIRELKEINADISKFIESYQKT